LDTLANIRIDTVYQVIRDTVNIFSHHLLNKDIGLVEVTAVVVSIVTLVIVGINSIQTKKLIKLNNNAFEAANRPYCTVKLDRINGESITKLDPANNIVYLTFKIANDRETFAEISHIRFYLFNSNYAKELQGFNDHFVLSSNETVTKHAQLSGDDFKKNDTFIVAIEYTGATAKTYHHYSYYTYTTYNMNDKPLEKDCTLRFTFHYVKSDTQGIDKDKEVKLTTMN
jgi:hypothetical protein